MTPGYTFPFPSNSSSPATSSSSTSTSSSSQSPSTNYSSTRPPKELRAEKGKQRGEIRGIERYRIMKLVLKGDFPEGKCVETPKRHLAGQKYWKKEAQVPSEVLASASYELDLQVLGSKGQLVEQCQKCRQESQKSSFVLVCCEGACSTEEGLCIPLICPCLPTHQNKQATFDLRVNLVNRSTREIEFSSTLPISFRTGKKKRGDEDSLSPSPKAPSPSKVSKHKSTSSPNLSSSSTPASSSSSKRKSLPIKEAQKLSSTTSNSHGSSTWYSNSTVPAVEFHWNQQPRQRPHPSSFPHSVTVTPGGGLMYQQEYETSLGQLTFRHQQPHPHYLSAPKTEQSFFFEAPAADYWLSDWLSENLSTDNSHFFPARDANGDPTLHTSAKPNIIAPTPIIPTTNYVEHSARFYQEYSKNSNNSSVNSNNHPHTFTIPAFQPPTAELEDNTTVTLPSATPYFGQTY